MQEVKLRIIAGALKGRFVRAPAGNKAFRPTQERVRESVAQILSNRIDDAVVADVCAGSGIFGFEMLSRGARRIDFVESDQTRAVSIQANAEKLQVSQKTRVYRRDVSSFVKNADGPYAILYFDPPYGDPEAVLLLPRLIALLDTHGVLLHERRRSKTDSARPENAELIDSREFGDSVVDFYARKTGCSPDGESDKPAGIPC